MTGKPKWVSSILGPVTAGSILERRATLSNDNGVVDGTAPPASREDVDYHGKFYPRGCRGVLESLSIYCIRTGSGTLTLGYAPHPGLGPIGSVTITPGSTWAWKSAAVEKMWNYDSLFIWVSAISSDVSWAYDAVSPPDGHSSDDSGATWEDTAERPFIRAVLTGETAGDVPVSGVVNTIPIPSVSSSFYLAASEAPAGIEVPLADIYGAGELSYIFCWWDTIFEPVRPVTYVIYIYIDDQPIALQIYNSLLTQSGVATSGECSIGAFWQDGLQTYMALWLPLQFRRHLDVRALQATGATCALWGWVVPNLQV